VTKDEDLDLGRLSQPIARRNDAKQPAKDYVEERREHERDSAMPPLPVLARSERRQSET
jgi:hypothetical protein